MNQPKNKKIVAFVVVIVLISLILLYTNRGSTDLELPTGAGVSNIVTQATEDEIKVKTYTNEKLSYTIKVPEDWKKIIKDGCDTYIHSPSATSVQIASIKYNPQFLSITAEIMTQEIAKEGGTLTNFMWINPTTYSVVYTKGKLIYTEITSFDRVDAIRFVLTVEEKNADKMIKYISGIIDGFQWTPKAPFPEGTFPVYSSYGNYEFVFPANWKTAISNNVYLAQDQNSGAVISVSATKSTATYEKYSQIDYANYASSGRPAYVLNSYSADKNVIYAQGTYNANNVPMVLVQYLLASGTFEYTLSFEIPQSYFNNYSSLINNIISTFRIY